MRRLLLTSILLLPGIARAQDTLDPGVENDLTLSLVTDGLVAATGMEFLPDGRLVIIQQNGDVFLWDGQNRDLAGSINTQDGGERGLLGIAIDPMFAATNRIYFYYSANGTQRVAWTTLDAQGQLDTANMNTIIDNLSSDANHDGGALAFGPDGHLYIGVGDTGCNCGCAPGTNNRNFFPTCFSVYHGKVLRIDRDGVAPAGNPLVGVAQAPECGPINQFGCASESVAMADPLDEIYNWGFRNPWRITFDSQTGYLWIGDVGEVTWEEVTISRGPGEHHGWPFREGMEGDAVNTCPMETPSVGDCVEPAFAYPHDEQPASGQGSITGGVFSNHCSWPAPYSGLYWFGDYNKARVWALTPNANRDGIDGDRTIIVRQAGGPVHFTAAPDGAILYTTINDGQIYRIAPANPAPCPDMDAGLPDAVDPDAMPGMDAMDQMDAMAMDAIIGDEAGVDPDSGLDKDAGNTNDAAPGSDTGTGGDEEDDCDCTATHSSGGAGGMWIVIGLVALRTWRRRRDR